MATDGEWTETDRQLSETMMAYWTQFAATGNPNRDDLPAWPEYDLSTWAPVSVWNDQHLNLDDTVTNGEGLHHAGGRLFRNFEKSRRAER